MIRTSASFTRSGASSGVVKLYLIVGNLFTLLPWPLDQIDHGTESAGHLLVMVLGLVLLREMAKSGECKETVQ